MQEDMAKNNKTVSFPYLLSLLPLIVQGRLKAFQLQHSQVRDQRPTQGQQETLQRKCEQPINCTLSRSEKACQP